LSDGSILAWGRNNYGQCNVPPLPPGLVYVEVTGGQDFSAARRSDGSVITWGDTRTNQHLVPTLPAGWTYTQIDAGEDFTIALFTSGGFNWAGAGCAGSGGIPALKAAAPPRLGTTLDVEISPPVAGPAVLLAGFSNTQSSLGPLPIDLAPLAMPGCALRVSQDFVVPFGNQHRAGVPIPSDPLLTGLTFHVQALVVDLAANTRGAIVSDAATAVVGG